MLFLSMLSPLIDNHLIAILKKIQVDQAEALLVTPV